LFRSNKSCFFLFILFLLPLPRQCCLPRNLCLNLARSPYRYLCSILHRKDRTQNTNHFQVQRRAARCMWNRIQLFWHCSQTFACFETARDWSRSICDRGEDHLVRRILLWWYPYKMLWCLRIELQQIFYLSNWNGRNPWVLWVHWIGISWSRFRWIHHEILRFSQTYPFDKCVYVFL